jgi:hypothetical protein
VLVEIRYVSEPSRLQLANVLREAYLHLFGKRYGFSSTWLEELWSEESDFVVLEMPGIVGVMEGERGTHLMYPPHENLVLVQVNLIGLAEGEDAGKAARAHVARRAAWREGIGRGERSVDDDPTPILPVVRIYEPQSVTLDLRTGLLCEGMPAGEDVRRFVVAALPVPPRLSE